MSQITTQAQIVQVEAARHQPQPPDVTVHLGSDHSSVKLAARSDEAQLPEQSSPTMGRRLPEIRVIDDTAQLDRVRGLIALECGE